MENEQFFKEPISNSGQQAVFDVIKKINTEALKLKREAKWMHSKHQVFTVSTILLGVSAPAVVTYSTGDLSQLWKIFAIILTAIATASATIRSVLRYSQRYSNAELTSLSLFHLQRQVQSKMYDVLNTVLEKFRDQKLYEIAAWADEQMFTITKSYVDKEVSAISQEQIKLTASPKIDDNQRIDESRVKN
jgi:hypothetical protein